MARILVVDDEHWCRVPLAKLLEFEGHETTMAADGVAALDALDDGPADLVLLDMMMPRMDGIGFLEEIRKRPEFDALPVILFTASRDKRKMEAAIELGVKDYVVKADTPFPKLMDLVNRRLADQGLN